MSQEKESSKLNYTKKCLCQVTIGHGNEHSDGFDIRLEWIIEIYLISVLATTALFSAIYVASPQPGSLGT